jgi:hypothetical protein
MTLAANIVSLIRDEVGDGTDFSDNDPPSATQLDSLEAIYTDANRGNGNVLVTALIVWRRRLANMAGRGFDVTKEGSWLARSQQVDFYQQQVSKYERLVADRPQSRNGEILSRAQQSTESSINPDS